MHGVAVQQMAGPCSGVLAAGPGGSAWHTHLWLTVSTGLSTATPTPEQSRATAPPHHPVLDTGPKPRPAPSPPDDLLMDPVPSGHSSLLPTVHGRCSRPSPYSCWSGQVQASPTCSILHPDTADCTPCHTPGQKQKTGSKETLRSLEGGWQRLAGLCPHRLPSLDASWQWWPRRALSGREVELRGSACEGTLQSRLLQERRG